MRLPGGEVDILDRRRSEVEVVFCICDVQVFFPRGCKVEVLLRDEFILLSATSFPLWVFFDDDDDDDVDGTGGEDGMYDSKTFLPVMIITSFDLGVLLVASSPSLPIVFPSSL